MLRNEELEELIQGLILNEVDYYTHLITGYSRSPDSLKQIAEVIKKLRQKNPQLIYGESLHNILFICLKHNLSYREII